MRLKQKVSLGISALVVGLVVSVMTIVNFATTRAVEGKIKKDLLAAQQVFDNFQELRFQKLLTYNKLAAEVPHLKALVTMPEIDHEIMQRITESVRNTVNSDLFIVYDAEGKVLVDAGGSYEVGTDHSEMPAIAAALRGENFQGMWVSERGFEQIVTSPFLFGDEIGGALLTGFVIDRDVVASVERMTNARVAVIGPNQFEVSREGRELFETVRKKQPGVLTEKKDEIVRRRIGGERYLLLASSFGSEQLTYVLARSLDYELLFYKKVRFRLVLVALLILGLALWLGMRYSRTITTPIEELAEGTHRLAAGDFDARVDIVSQDEIGELAGAFNQMTGDLKRSRNEILSAKEYTENIIRSMVDTVIVVNPDATIRRVNQATCKLLGFGEDELVGRPVTSILDGGGKGLLDEQGFNGLMKKGSVRDVEQTYVAKDGHAVPVSFSASVMKDPVSGEPQGVVFAAQDLTERKRLEQRVFQSEKLAAVGQLAGGVAHEINNPLGVILGFAQGVVKRVKKGDPLEMPLRSIEREAVRCKTLVQDLLTFSRVGKPEKEEIDLNDTVRGALSLVRAQSKVKGMEIEEAFAKDLPRIHANNVQVQQIVVNLSNNAIDAMPRGGKLIVRTCQRTHQRKEWACLEIEDNGPGIPPDIRKRIFEPFFTTKDVGKGTGLGLSLVYEIVRKHDGEISLESEVGKGTRFRILLPLQT